MKIIAIKKPSLEVLKRRIMGLLIIPLLYARCSFLVFFPILLLFKVPIYSICLLWVIYVMFFCMLMGNFGLMHYWTKLFQSLFEIQYISKGYWQASVRIPWAGYDYPIIEVRDKNYKIIVKTLGDTLYESEDSIRRKAIYYWFFG